MIFTETTINSTTQILGYKKTLRKRFTDEDIYQ